MNKFKKINWIILGLLVITNIAFYPFLPDKIAMQFSFTGEVNRYASKEVGLLTMPAILFIVNLLQSKDDSKVTRLLVINSLVFFLNIAMNIVNLVR